jgi:hypothetical protein
MVQVRIEHVIKVLHKNKLRHFDACLSIMDCHGMINVVSIDLSKLA